MRITLDLTILMDFISEIMGENAEIVLHKIEDMNTSTIVDIRNGYITGRESGMPLTDFAKQMIAEFNAKDEKTYYKINYLSVTKAAKKLRSSSLLLCDDNNIPKAILCINHDDIIICNIIQQLRKMITINDNQNIKENFSNNVKGINAQLINDILAKYPSPLERLTSDDKLILIRELSEKGVFLIKGSVEMVAKSLKMSEPTLYRYLKQI